MRVIAGSYRSRPLAAPRGLATRPTSDRLRETLFNVLAFRIPGCTFADLYAGSGANGIEALSRGAGQVYFVENGPAALAAIRANLESLGIRSGFAIEGRSVAAFLGRITNARPDNATPDNLRADSARLDIVFLDPPYADDEAYADTLGLLGSECAAVLAPDAMVIAEHRHKQPLKESYGVLRRTRVLKQGDAALSVYAAASNSV